MKLFGHIKKKSSSYNRNKIEEKSKDNPPNKEGKEPVKYKNPGFSKHEIDIPDDEPSMRSKLKKGETFRPEDNFHMDVPDQTPKSLPSKVKKAMMKMSAEDQEDPKPMYANPVRTIPKQGVEDEDGEENEEEDKSYRKPKEDRKKMIVAVLSRKMKKS